MKVGTCHFETLAHAKRYYKAMGFTFEDVLSKLLTAEIALGPPMLATNQRCSLDSDGRYWIESSISSNAGATS